MNMRLIVFLGCLWVLSASSPAAGIVSDLYQAAVPVPDHSEAGLDAAYQAAMKQVLVRVTGRRTASQDPVFAPLSVNARRYLQQYKAAQGNQLFVAFDGAAIERWLAQNGLPIWGRERPTTAVLLAVASNGGVVLTRADQSELKRSLELTAQARGIVLIWPTTEQLQRAGIGYSSLAANPAMTFSDAGRALGADGVLVGRASDASGSATVRWTHVFQAHSSEFSGAQEGANHAADTYAALFATSGGVSAVVVEISGVEDLASYAAIQGYLESLTLVSRVTVVGFQADTAKFQVIARGGAEALQRALALEPRLGGLSSDLGVIRFRFNR
jgi:uncharacterized protein